MITFKLEHCNCTRRLPISDQTSVHNVSVIFNQTTCGIDAFRRGLHQKVAGFSFYGDTNSDVHKAKKYFEGIKENLGLLTELYDESWTMRLYFDLNPGRV